MIHSFLLDQLFMPDRLFLGIPLTDEARAELALQLGNAFPHGIPGKPVPAANWHLTLRFLGDTPPDAAARVRGEAAAGDLGPQFRITFGELGAFPRATRAKVVWLGITEGAQPLRQLAGALETRVRVAGLPAEARPFSPHLTLARLREPVDLGAALSTVSSPRLTQAVTHVALFRSHLGAGPPRYEIVERFSL